MKHKWLIILIGVSITAFLVGSLLYSQDIFPQETRYFILSDSIISSARGKYVEAKVLVSNPPVLQHSIKRDIERIYWSTISIDTLSLYLDHYTSYYRETKYLTPSFKEGFQYVPRYSSWDNTMDWRNHQNDLLGRIHIRTRSDGSGSYYCYIEPTGWGIFFLRSFTSEQVTREDYNSIKVFYKYKQRELGIED